MPLDIKSYTMHFTYQHPKGIKYITEKSGDKESDMTESSLKM